METPNYIFENGGFLLDQRYIFFYFWLENFRYLSIISTRFPPDKHTQRHSSPLQKMPNPLTSPLSNNVKLKRVSKVYHVLYNNSAGGNNVSKFQRTDEFTREVCLIIYYVHMTTYNIINCNCPHVLVQFHTRKYFRASLSVRISDSGHPVTYVRRFWTKHPCHKIYRCMSVRSTRHY